MNARIFRFLAETSVHVGSSRSEGVVDLPVAREAITGYPYVPGSGLKGALRQHIGNTDRDTNLLFGPPDSSSAGQLLIGDARLLLLPVRSLNKAAMWATCPHLLERYVRDSAIANATITLDLPPITRNFYYAASDAGTLMLEELAFKHEGKLDAGVIETISKILEGASDKTCARFKERMVLLHDDDFAWFARNGIPVNARNLLNQETKVSENLWYEESLPPDTILYSLIGDRKNDGLEKLISVLQKRSYLQLGGNETVGMGWVRVLAASTAEPGSVA